MKLKKNIIETLIITALISSALTYTYAEGTKNISIEPIFTKEDGLWNPGRVEQKDFYITNNKENTISIDRLYLQLKSSKNLKTNEILNTKSKEFKELAKNTTVELTYGNKVLFKSQLDKLLKERGIALSEEIYILSNKKALLNMSIYINEETGNDAQSLENIFSVGVAYKDESDKGDITNPDIPTIKPEEPKPDTKPEPDKPVNPDGNSEDDNESEDNSEELPQIDGDIDSGELPQTGGNNKPDKLPQTGGVVNSASLLALGTIIIGIGVTLNKNSSKEKGGKHHE